MEYIRKFDNEYDLELFLSDAENNEKVRNYDTKMFYLEEEERMIIGSGRKDVPLDFTKTNAEMQNYDKAHVSSNPNDTVEYNIYYKKLPKGQTNINLASVTGVTGYVVDEDNSKVKMILEDSSLYTTLTKDSDWKYNYADGNVTLLRAIEGDILLDFKGLLYTNLRDNSIILYISHNGGERIELYRNGTVNDAAVNLISGEEYEVTATIASGGTLSMAVKSGVSYCSVNGNFINPTGYKNSGGKCIITFSSTVHNGYKPIDVNIQFDVSLEVAKILNWDSIVPSNQLTAGEELDLRGLRVSGNSQFFIQTTERIQTTNVERVYKLVGNGSDALNQRIRINIIGNELYTGSVIDKYVDIRLNTNTMSWNKVIWDNVGYTDFNSSTKKFTGLENIVAGHPNGLTLDVNATSNEDNINYSITPTGLGNFIGNIFYPTLPAGEARDVTINARINAHGDYRVAQLTANFRIQPVTITVNQWQDGTIDSNGNEINEFYGGEFFNLMYKLTTPSTTAIPNYVMTVNPKSKFVIIDGKLMLGTNQTLESDDGAKNREVEVKITINPGSNFKKTEIIRKITCKLKPARIDVGSSLVLYDNTDMTTLFTFSDAVMQSNYDISKQLWDRFSTASGGFTGNNRVMIKYSLTDLNMNNMNDTIFSSLSNFLQESTWEYNTNYGGGIKWRLNPDLDIYGSNRTAIWIIIRFKFENFGNYEFGDKPSYFKFTLTRP